MKIAIIGNGIAGVMTANNLRTLKPDGKMLEIHIFTKEPYPYYARIRLPEIFGLDKIIKDIQIYREDWYDKRSIKVHYDHEAVKIIPEEKKIIFTNNNAAYYDKLVMAIGADGIIPEIKNNDLDGIFRIREYNDAIAIKSHIASGAKHAVILGGGLLGLETAKYLGKLKDITIVEFFPRLLPRQLDEEGAAILKGIIENMGIKIKLNSQAIEFIGKDHVEQVILNDGTSLKADTVVLSLGIRPRIGLAKDSGLKVNRGIVVNKFLQTSNEHIYAAGDIAEYDNIVWGIIPAALEHAGIVAQNIISDNTLEYRQTIPKTTLKVVDIDLTSMGKVILNPEEADKYDIVIKSDTVKKTYEKFILENDILTGAIVLGNKNRVKWVENNMNKKIDRNSLI